MSLFVDMLQPVLQDVPVQKQMTSSVTIIVTQAIIRAEVAIFPTETNVLVRSNDFLIMISVKIIVYINVYCQTSIVS